MIGFAVFLVLEQFLHWHHCHRMEADCRQPLGCLILLGDGLQNFLGGLGVAGVFLIDVRLGVLRESPLRSTKYRRSSAISVCSFTAAGADGAPSCSTCSPAWRSW
jgi:hypothetical protein